MASLNKTLLIGRLGRDPELKYMQNGNAVCGFSIATSETWKDKSGEKQEKTEWHNVVMFGKLAEIAGEYLNKGSEVYIEGKIETKTWQDKEGNDRQTTQIIANEMKMLGSPKSSEQKPAQQKPQTTQQTNKSAQNYARQSGGSSHFDDDIPF